MEPVSFILHLMLQLTLFKIIFVYTSGGRVSLLFFGASYLFVFISQSRASRGQLSKPRFPKSTHVTSLSGFIAGSSQRVVKFNETGRTSSQTILEVFFQKKQRQTVKWFPSIAARFSSTCFSLKQTQISCAIRPVSAFSGVRAPSLTLERSGLSPGPDPVELCPVAVKCGALNTVDS